MSCLIIDHEDYFGDICEVIRLFTHERHILSDYDGNGLCIRASLEMKGVAVFDCELIRNSKSVATYTYETPVFESSEYKKLAKRGFKICVYRLLENHFGRELPWGSLTGIRPTKLLRELEETEGMFEAKRIFEEDFGVSGAKYELTRSILGVQNAVMASIRPDDVDIYVGIPYCTSKCAYCSFSSGITRGEGDTEEYTAKLLGQINALLPIICDNNVRSIYVGGGTPTALSADQLKRVLEALPQASLEFCVEAGRPDTITAEKLDIIANSGADKRKRTDFGANHPASNRTGSFGGGFLPGV